MEIMSTTPGTGLGAMIRTWRDRLPPLGRRAAGGRVIACGWPAPSPCAWTASTCPRSRSPRPQAGQPRFGLSAERPAFRVAELENTGLKPRRLITFSGLTLGTYVTFAVWYK
jgi:hypothetical protein